MRQAGDRDNGELDFYSQNKFNCEFVANIQSRGSLTYSSSHPLLILVMNKFYEICSSSTFLGEEEKLELKTAEFSLDSYWRRVQMFLEEEGLEEATLL